MTQRTMTERDPVTQQTVSMTAEEKAAFERKRRQRNTALLAVLAVLAIAFYVITVVKLDTAGG